MASVRKIANSRQHHHSRPAAEIPRTQSGRKHLAVYARQLALEPHLQILRRYRRSLLLRLEYAPRPALENHVHRITPVGSWVLINEMRYNRLFGCKGRETSGTRISGYGTLSTYAWDGNADLSVVTATFKAN